MRKEFTSLFMLSVGGQLVVEGNVVSLCRNRDSVLEVHQVGDGLGTVPTVLDLDRFTRIQVDRVKFQAG